MRVLKRCFGRRHDLPQLDPVNHPDHADQEQRAGHAEAEPERQRSRQDVGDADALDDQHAVEDGNLARQNPELLDEQRTAGRRGGAADVKPAPEKSANAHQDANIDYSTKASLRWKITRKKPW
jgi:hypothetical protein